MRNGDLRALPRRPHRGAGFTLIELLVVVAIIGILAAAAVGQYQRSIRKAQEAALRQNLYVMRTQINNYFSDKQKYPSSLDSLVEDHYLRDVPVDPVTKSRDTWITEAAEMGEEDISQEPGIADVRSGAEGQATDGTNYSEW
jgi:general secretion pathway protein G